MRIKSSLLALAIVAAFGLATEARAAIIFDYSAALVLPMNPDPQPTVTLTYTPLADTGDAMGLGTDIKVSFLDLTAPIGTGPVFSAFTFDITITDMASGQLDSFTLSGTLFGGVTANSSGLDFTWSGSVTKQVGFFLYKVEALFIDVPTISFGGTPHQGSITAHVSVLPIPEPSTLALAALGGLGLVGMVRRRKRV